KMEDPIGKTIQVDERGFSELKIIGVVEDYNFMSLKNRIEPAILNMIPYLTMRKIIVKFSGENILETINKMEKVWKEIEPEKPFLYSFLDEDIERAYNSERRWGSIVKYSSIFAILITCMGIFGLTSIIVNRRIKEIGIRKVLGAGVATLSNMLIREFVILVAAANIIVWPITWIVMDGWLQDFAYRTELNPFLFLTAGVLTLCIAMITISWLVIKAANSNPVDSLRYE
ncbi:MAG: FtsX-like permease family protein, partial [bacterium]|nr:FtsX-like permease family protein [bacterium]